MAQEMSKKQKLLAKIEEMSKDKKNKTMKMGKLSNFAVSGLQTITPTLHLPIDDIAGGFSEGCIIELWGDESSGKSTTLGKVFENWKVAFPDGSKYDNRQKTVLYIDSEGR